MMYRLTSSFFVLHKYFDTHFVDNVPFPGLYGGLYGENLPYKFKKLDGDFLNRKSEKTYTIDSIELAICVQNWD